MAQRKQTPLSGITTTPVYEDGSTCSLVNLRPKNGALRPVTPRKVMQRLSQKYDIVFIHKNNDWANWIGVIGNKVYWNILKTPQITAETSGKINSVQQVGNTLSLITEDGVYYLLFQNGVYRYLGELPPIPTIKLRSSEAISHSRTLDDEYGTEVYNIPDNWKDSIKGLVYKLMREIAEGYTDKDGVVHEKQKACLFDACFVRYAFRLFDGTLTKHSPPILVMPNSPILSLKTMSTFQVGTDGRNDGFNITIEGYKLEGSYDFTLEGDWWQWVDIIQSVDIFLSAPLGLSNIENIRGDLPREIPNTPYGTSQRYRVSLIGDITPETIESVKDASSFYFAGSIPWEGKVAENTTIPSSNESAVSNMANLIHQEVMSDDQLSNHKFGANVSYTHNNRLHLGDTKTTFFKGFDPRMFLWGSNYNTDRLPSGSGSPNYSGGSYAPDSWPPAFNPNDTTGKLIIEVEINTGATIERVYATSAGTSVPALYSSAFLSYPDPRASKITIYQMGQHDIWERRFTAALTPHKFLNLAYCLDDQFRPITGDDLGDYPTRDTSRTITLSEPNKLKVSELNNPLVFPVRNAYQVGDGTIMAIATNAMNVSDRNYGQHPLYIFTTHGVWTLNVGAGEVAYSTLSSPTYMEAPISRVIGETPYGAVFATQCGLMVINGRSVDFISSQIEDAPKRMNIEINSHCDGVVYHPEDTKFSKLLEGLTALIYNPFENELIIDTGSELNYVLSFLGKSFYQSTENINVVVGNSYPDLFVVGNDTLKNYAAHENPLAHVSLTTRPLLFGTSDIKRFERMVLRGLFCGASPTGGKSPLYMVHGSMDGVNFKAQAGYMIHDGDNMDLDSGLLSRAKFTHALFSLAGTMSEESEIRYLDTVFEMEYSNTKMR